jgi:hypothetical protein
VRHLYIFETPYLYFVLGQQLLFLLWENGDVGKEIIMMISSEWASRARNPLALSIWLMAQRHRRPTHTRATAICVIYRASRGSIKERKKMNRNIFFSCHANRNSIDLPNYFFFPAIIFYLKKRGVVMATEWANQFLMMSSIFLDVQNAKSERESMIDEKDRRLGF